jgi:hypothetical protein
MAQPAPARGHLAPWPVASPVVLPLYEICVANHHLPGELLGAQGSVKPRLQVFTVAVEIPSA